MQRDSFAQDLTTRAFALLSAIVLIGGPLVIHGLARAGADEDLVLTPPAAAVPSSYFGIHVHRAISRGTERPTVWPSVGVGSLRLWDSYVSWSDLEPAPGVWRFERLDSLVALAAKHHMSVCLTLGRTPRWASSRPREGSAYGPGEQAMPKQLATWENYVRVVATRYKGRIAAYEIWNEPNQRGMFSGSVGDVARLAAIAYRTVKMVDPAATVVSPSPARGDEGIAWVAQYARAGGLHNADVIGFHPYVTNATPEAMAALVLRLRRGLDRDAATTKPIWITELGWFVQDRSGTVKGSTDPMAFDHTILSDTVAGAYVARALALGWCTGSRRLMWYAWDNGRMGLLEPDRQTEKLAATAFRTMAGWMTDATISRCSRSNDGRWTIDLARANGRRARRWASSVAATGSPRPR